MNLCVCDCVKVMKRTRSTAGESKMGGGWVEVGGILGEGQNCLSTLSLQQPGKLIML